MVLHSLTIHLPPGCRPQMRIPCQWRLDQQVDSSKQWNAETHKVVLYTLSTRCLFHTIHSIALACHLAIDYFQPQSVSTHFLHFSIPHTQHLVLVCPCLLLGQEDQFFGQLEYTTHCIVDWRCKRHHEKLSVELFTSNDK